MTEHVIPTLPTRTRRSFWIDFAVVGVIFGVVLILYSASLRFPFVWFDADDLARSIRYSPTEIIAGMPRYPYYRPLIFLFWKLILTTWGSDSAPMFHAYLIGAHFLCAVLLFKFVSDLARNRTIAAAAALLFVTYPFSYQAITWSTAQSHPTNLALVLTCAILYRRAREQTHQRLLYFAAAACLVAAMLIHESAYVGALMVLATELYLFFEHRVTGLSVWPVVYFCLTIGVYFVYRSASKAPPVETTLQPETGLYLLQGLIYPFTMLLARACTALGCATSAWLLPAGILIVCVMILLWRSGRTLLLGLFGLIWFGLEIMPVWAGRDYIYIQYAPRLLYSAAAGAAVALAALLGRRSGSRQQIVALCLVILSAFQSAQFVMGRDGLHGDAFRLTDQANRALFTPRQGSALFVDVPELYTYREQEFPLGWYGVMVAPWHNQLGAATNLRADDANWVIDPAHAQQVQDQARLKLDFHGQVLSPDQLQTMIVSATQVYRVETLHGDLHLFNVGAIQRHAPEPDSSLAEWSNTIRLITATIESEVGVPVLNLDWWIGGPIDPNQTVFVHLLDDAGEIVAQADGEPIEGYAPFNLWPQGTRLNERRPLLSLSNLPARDYTVVVGLYDRASLQRTPPQPGSAVTSDGAVIASQIKR